MFLGLGGYGKLGEEPIILNEEVINRK